MVLKINHPGKHRKLHASSQTPQSLLFYMCELGHQENTISLQAISGDSQRQPYGHSGLVKFTVLAESLVALSYFLVSVPPHARLQWALPSPPSKGVLHHTQLSLCCPSCCLLAACHEPPASSGLLAQPCAVSLRPLCSTGTDGMSLRVTWNPAALFFCSCFRG